MPLENKIAEDAPLTFEIEESTGTSRTSLVLRLRHFPFNHCCRSRFFGILVVLSLFLSMLFLPTLTKNRAESIQDMESKPIVNVAFVGNSMFYFNDFPRFFQLLAADTYTIHQDSCLHGGGSISSLLVKGNSMHPQFATPAALLKEPSIRLNHSIYDYGACTPQQLVLGADDRLARFNDTESVSETAALSTSSHNINPCHVDPIYLHWSMDYYKQQHITVLWNYVVINDNTRNPARASTRAQALQSLRHEWLPILQASGATPVFLWTHAYTPLTVRNMTGMEDIANFTSLTYAGIQAYVRELEPFLSADQEPRIAASGLCFLAVYEDDRDMWHRLFHNADHLHASPAGTLLQGLAVYHALFGTLPSRRAVTQSPASLWQTARMMQHAWEPPNPMPTFTEATYLYDVAERVLVQGKIPSSFINYTHGEVAYGQD